MKIFVASTGRCGTTFFTSMFNFLTDIPSFHEPVPKCRGKVMEEMNTGAISPETADEILKKMKQIERDSSPEGHYFESHNLFMKSYFSRALASFRDIYCIYLHRNIVDVVRSFAPTVEKKHVLYRSLLRPHWRNNILRMDTDMSWFEVVVWNWYEIRARYYRWKTAFSKTYEFDFARINLLEEWYKMFDYFGIKHRKVDLIPYTLKRDNHSRDPSILLSEEMDFIRNKWGEK